MIKIGAKIFNRNVEPGSEKYLTGIKVFASVFASSGLVLIISSIIISSQTWRFLITAKITNGTVVEIITVAPSTVRHTKTLANKVMYKPVFYYRDFKGNMTKYISKISSNPASYQIGDEVELYISPESNKVIVNQFIALYGAELVLIILGLVFLLISWLSYVLLKVMTLVRVKDGTS